MAAAGDGAPAVACEVPESTDTDPCTAPLKPNDDRLCKMMIGGEEREFYIYASPKYDPCTPASMIMDCHGASESIDVHTGREGFNLSGLNLTECGSGFVLRNCVDVLIAGCAVRRTEGGADVVVDSSCQKIVFGDNVFTGATRIDPDAIASPPSP